LTIPKDNAPRHDIRVKEENSKDNKNAKKSLDDELKNF